MNLSIMSFTYRWLGISITIIFFASILLADTIKVPEDYPTIQEAINASSEGDTILVGPGIYIESVTMKRGVSLLGSGPYRSTIISPDGDKNTINTSNNAFVEGFTIAKDKSGSGVLINCESKSPTIRNNVIIKYGNPSVGDIGIFARSSSPLIEKNFFLNFDIGIFLYEASPVVKNNIVKAWYGILSNDGAPIIINNTVLASRIIGINSNYRGIVQNNIAVNIGSAEDSGIKAGSGVDLGYNNQWNFPREGDSGVGGISADPLFVDQANDLYQLSEDSPSKDAGNPDTLFNDLDGTRNDMGAYGGPDPISSTITQGLDKSVEISKHSGFPGDTIRVTVKMNNPIGLQGAIFLIEYDNSILDAINVENTTTTENFILTADYETEGQVYALMEDTTEVRGGSGDILNIEFRVSDSARSGDVTAIKFASVSLLDATLQPYDLKIISDGYFVVNQGSEVGQYIYVDSRSDSLGDGSRISPFNTIHDGILNASSGDTIVAVGGDYTGQLIMKEGVYLRGAGAKVTKILGAEEEPTISFNSIEEGEISGFTIYGPSQVPDVWPIISVSSSSPRITNNRLEKTIVDLLPAIEVFNLSSPIIEHNAIIESGLYLDNSSAIISHNFIDGSDGRYATLGLYNSSNADVSNNMIIAGRWDTKAIAVQESSKVSIISNKILCSKDGGDCIFVEDAVKAEIFNNLIEDIMDNTDGITVRNSTDVVLLNNVINTGNVGVDENLSDMRAFNNIITGAGDYGITASLTSEIDYNDLWNNVTNYYLIDPGEHDISEDPIFIDMENHDYRLGVSSPAIDAGHPGIEYNDTDGSRNDMGIFGGPYADTTGIFKVGPVLSIPNTSGAPGDTIKIQVEGRNIESISNLLGRITIDPNILSYLMMETTDLTNTFSLTREIFSSEMIGFTLESATSLKQLGGTLVEISFIISENAEQNSTTSVNFDYAAALDELAVPHSNLKVENGEIRITPVGVKEVVLSQLTFKLSQNYPNPFNPVTVIHYTIPNPGFVKLTIFNLLGQEVSRLVNDHRTKGSHQVIWNASNFASGIYFYRLQAGDFVQTRKMVLLK